MGTTSSSNAVGDSLEVVVRLEGHSIPCNQDDVVYGMVTNHSSIAETSLNTDRPAKVVANFGSMVSIRFFIHQRGNSSAQDRPVGQVSIPIRCMIERCGMSFFHARFLLSPCSPYEELQQQQLVQAFDRALDDVGQKPFEPMVCLTIHKSEEDPEEWASDSEKRAASYPCLLLSTMQHMQLVKALRDRSRSNAEDGGSSLAERLNKKKDQIKMLKDQSIEQQETIANLQMRHQEVQNQQPGPNQALLERLKTLRQQNQQLRAAAASGASASSGQPSAEASPSLVPTPEIQRLRDDLVCVTSEANARIDKANDSIQTLRAKLKSLRDVDMPRHQQQKADLEKKCEDLQNQKAELMKWQHENSGQDGEIAQLRHQLQVVVEQKTALMSIVDKLYGTVKEDAPVPGPAGLQEPNMLPSPRSLVGGDLKPL